MIAVGGRIWRVLRNLTSSSPRLFEPLRRLPMNLPAPPSARFFSYKNESLTPNSVTMEMIQYAMSVAREQITEESLSRGLLVLEQCESMLSDDNSKGFVELARSTLLFERGCHEAAIEKLGRIQELNLSSIAIKVAASEALVGVYLELQQDDAASVAANLALKLLSVIKLELGDVSRFVDLELRIKALKGLISLAAGDLDSAQAFFDGIDEVETPFIGSAILSCGEFLHVKRDFSTARKFYQRVLKESSDAKTSNIHGGACNMTSEEVSISAACALGQLEAQMRNFSDAEEVLTSALKKTEEHFGSHHPKVGVILTCIALMYRQKAVAEHSSSLLLQEGLFRRAIELLKSPPLETGHVKRKDVMALARGGYADTLLVQQSRKGEGERVKKWAETAWNNRRVSLAEALEVSQFSTVIDARICRVI